jgi:frataxin-like iron-binding protein CyaY
MRRSATRVARSLRPTQRALLRLSALPRPSLVSAAVPAAVVRPPWQPLRRWCSAPAATPADAFILSVHRALEDGKGATSETFEPRITEAGVLELNLGEKGYYTLARADDRLLLFSPTSGPKYYVFDAENDWWVSPDDGHLLVEILVRELMHTTSVCINL